MTAGNCSLYPSLKRTGCSHCDGSARGTESNPKYTLTRLPIDPQFGELVEILKNGGPVHRFDEHFQFGRTKCSVMLAAISVIREFAWLPDAHRFSYSCPGICSVEFGSISVEVRLKKSFIRSTGDLIRRPWLYLEADRVRVRLGYQKCRAVSALRDQLRAWVEEAPRRAQDVVCTDFQIELDDHVAPAPPSRWADLGVARSATG